MQKHDRWSFTHNVGVQRRIFDLDFVGHDLAVPITTCAMIWPGSEEILLQGVLGCDPFVS